MARRGRWARASGTALAVGALAVGALVVDALATAVPARADTQSYLEKLHAAGINTPRGDLELQEWGWEACELIAKGFPPDKVLQQAVYNDGPVPQYDMSVEQADTVVHVAVTDLCTARK